MVKWIRNTKAFTLIELMIVVVIIAILAVIAIPNFIEFREKLGKSSDNKTAIIEQYTEKKKGGHQGDY